MYSVEGLLEWLEGSQSSSDFWGDRLVIYVLLFEPARKWRKYSALVKLKLMDMHSTSLPDWFVQLTGLKCLKLDNSFLKKFPACIFTLVSTGKA